MADDLKKRLWDQNNILFDSDDELLVVDEVDSKKSSKSAKEQRSLSSVRVDYVVDKDLQDDNWRCLKPAVVPVTIIVLITSLVVILPLIMNDGDGRKGNKNDHLYSQTSCYDTCTISLAESIPESMPYPSGSPRHTTTFSAWMKLLNIARNEIEIASFYWTLRGSDLHLKDPSARMGEVIFDSLMDAGTGRQIKIRIAQSEPTSRQKDLDTRDLVSYGAAEVRSLNFERFMGGGILHTKFWLVDRKHFYIGSANMDFRSLSQVKELGVILTNCSCLAKDLGKIFDVYWYMGQPNATVPKSWDRKYWTVYNNTHPVLARLNGTNAKAYLSSSPAGLCPKGRTVDINSILDVIDKARSFIAIAVMDYIPITMFTKPRRFWPVIDDALKKASLENGVNVKILISWWNSSDPDMLDFLRSTVNINGAMKANVEVKVFQVPPIARKIPYSRVNHNKYMVTDNAAYIGTSNWSGDYFVNTGGVGLIINQTHIMGIPHHINTKTLQDQLYDVFKRDWDSAYSTPLKDFVPPKYKR